MDIITFQCSNCQKVMRIDASKAGKKAKCSKCGQSLVIPSQSQPLGTGGAGQAARLALFGEEDDNVYKFQDAPEVESQATGKDKKLDIKDLYKVDDEDDEDEDEDDAAAEAEEEKEREQRRLLSERRREALSRLRKAPIDFAMWEKVRLGILLIIVGVFFWMGAVLFQKLPWVFGMSYQAQYASIAATQLVDRSEEIVPGKPLTLYRTRFIVGLIGGGELVEVNLWLFRTSYLFTLVQLVCTGTGYAFCLSAPSRFGCRPLAVALLPMVAFSFILTLTLKLLPMAGAYTYTMIQLLAPEVALVRTNIEREVPIHLFWANAPFLESFLAILLHLTTFGELVLFCIFLRGVAQNLKDEKLQQPVEPLIRLGLSIGFILMGFHLLINTGTTEVLINVLCIVYVFAVSFYAWFLIWYVMTLFYARERIAKQIHIYGGDDVPDEDEEEEIGEEYEEYEEDDEDEYEEED